MNSSSIESHRPRRFVDSLDSSLSFDDVFPPPPTRIFALLCGGKQRRRSRKWVKRRQKFHFRTSLTFIAHMWRWQMWPWHCARYQSRQAPRMAFRVAVWRSADAFSCCYSYVSVDAINAPSVRRPNRINGRVRLIMFGSLQGENAERINGPTQVFVCSNALSMRSIVSNKTRLMTADVWANWVTEEEAINPITLDLITEPINSVSVAPSSKTNKKSELIASVDSARMTGHYNLPSRGPAYGTLNWVSIRLLSLSASIIQKLLLIFVVPRRNETERQRANLHKKLFFSLQSSIRWNLFQVLLLLSWTVFACNSKVMRGREVGKLNDRQQEDSKYLANENNGILIELMVFWECQRTGWSDSVLFDFSINVEKSGQKLREAERDSWRNFKRLGSIFPTPNAPHTSVSKKQLRFKWTLLSRSEDWWLSIAERCK